MEFSRKIMEIKPSATLSITSKAKAMLAAGEDIIILAAGEPDFDTPEIIKKAGIDRINKGHIKYTPAGGTKSLKEAICRKLKNDNNLDYSINEIVVSNGAKHSLYNVLQVICNPEDEVLVISPYWVSYPEMVKLAGGVPRVLQTRVENGFKLIPEQLEAALNEKTKALILNSPSNPAGVVYDKQELEKIAGICSKTGIVVISDEIYEKIIFDNKKHFSIAAVSDKIRALTVVVNGLSKSYSMTGWRIGYLAADKELVSKVSTLQSHATSNPCSVSQAAAEFALTSDLEEEMKMNCLEFQKRRDSLIEMFSDEKRLKPFKPEGAFYLFCDVSKFGMDSMMFAQRLLEEEKVAVIPGGPFGDDRFIRISFAADMETIKLGVNRIKSWVKKI
ncbi:MAG: pyridoxal phosphate-dependent aminotransferase [Candidatus Omnitrophota bacterium]